MNRASSDLEQMKTWRSQQSPLEHERSSATYSERSLIDIVMCEPILRSCGEESEEERKFVRFAQ